MGKKILDSKALYVALSILLSVFAWLYVTSQDETKDSQSFRLPVTFTDVDILEERGLMIVNENVTASVTIRATPMVLATLSSDPPQLTASVSNISSEGSQSIIYTVKPPSGVREGDLEIIQTGLSGNVVTVNVARYLRRENIEIRGEFQGTVAEDCLPGDKDDFLFSPGTLTISGQAELVNQVAYAKVVVTGDDLDDTVRGDRPFQLFGANDNPLEGLDVTCDVDTVYTVFPIRATAEIPLEVKVTPGGGLGEDDVALKLSTPSIMVAGSREAVAALSNEGAITLASIDLACVRDGDELTYAVPLADELENLSGVTEVKVTVDVRKQVETRTFEVTSSISTIGTPEGWRADIITQVLPVEIRGTKALLDELIEENIRVVANLQNVNQAAGQYTVPVMIYLGSAGSKAEIGELDPNGYTIVISLSRDG